MFVLQLIGALTLALGVAAMFGDAPASRLLGAMAVVSAWALLTWMKVWTLYIALAAGACAIGTSATQGISTLPCVLGAGLVLPALLTLRPLRRSGGILAVSLALVAAVGGTALGHHVGRVTLEIPCLCPPGGSAAGGGAAAGPARQITVLHWSIRAHNGMTPAQLKQRVLRALRAAETTPR